MFGNIKGTNNRVELGEVSSAGIEHEAKPGRLANDWVIQQQVWRCCACVAVLCMCRCDHIAVWWPFGACGWTGAQWAVLLNCAY